MIYKKLCKIEPQKPVDPTRANLNRAPSKSLTPEEIMGQYCGAGKLRDLGNRWPDVDWNNTEWAKFGNWSNSPPPK